MAAVSKRERDQKALNDVTENEENISAGITGTFEKSNDIISSPAFTDELEKLRAQLQQLQIEKSKRDEMLKEKDEILKEKDEILKKKDEQQEKLQADLKKLQKVKSLKEKDIKKNNKSTKSTLKKPCNAYSLWLKDQWPETKKENPEATRWKHSSAEEKKPYEEKYQQNKDAYLQDVGKEKRETGPIEVEKSTPSSTSSPQNFRTISDLYNATEIIDGSCRLGKEKIKNFPSVKSLIDYIQEEKDKNNMEEFFGYSSGSKQVAVRDGVVYLSDDDVVYLSDDDVVYLSDDD